MKLNLKFFTVALAAMMFAACTPDGIEPNEPNTPNNPEEDNKEEEVVLNQDLAFTIEVVSVEKDVAKLNVSHNGKIQDPWFGFYTTDVDADNLTLINAEIQAMLAEGGVKGIKNQTSTTVTLRGLEPATDYKYVVFGLSEKGEFYGTPASVEFTTAKPEVMFKENSAWKVIYNGAGTINGTDYEHTVTVESTDANKYFITAVTKSDYETYGIKAIAEDNLAYLKSYVDAFNSQNGTNYSINDILFQGTGTDAVMLEAGIDWYALAIGVDAAGDLSGFYGISNVITIDEEEPTKAYSSWIGDWVFTGANGLSQNVTFSKGISNKTYKMTGYEGAEAEGLVVTVEWDAENEIWAIYNQNLGTYDFGQYGEGQIWFLGMEESGNLYLSEVPICLGGKLEDGSLAAYGYSEEWEEDGEQYSFNVSLMSFLAYFPADNSLSYITTTYEVGYPTFPMIITPAEATKSSVQADKNAMVVSNLVKPYRTFGSLR